VGLATAELACEKNRTKRGPLDSAQWNILAVQICQTATACFFKRSLLKTTF